MASITLSRRKPCKNTLGGVKSVYLAPWYKIPFSELEYDGVVITEMPVLDVYRFESVVGTDFTQDMQENEGGKYHDINLTLTFNKISIFDNLNFQNLLKKDYFVIVEDWNGNFLMSGFENGLTAESLQATTTQYTITFTGQEEKTAPIVTGIFGTDIIVVDFIDYIFQNDDNYYFQDDNNYIF
jgi:hypothetical protein